MTSPEERAPDCSGTSGLGQRTRCRRCSRPIRRPRRAMTPPISAPGPAAGRRYDPGVPFDPVAPSLDLVALEQPRPDAVGHRRRVRREPAPARRRPRMGLLRGPADRQRAARHPPRLGPAVQGPLPPVPHHAGSPRGPEGRLGLPRPPGRGRGREGARHPQQARDRGLRHRRVQPAAAASRCSATCPTSSRSPSASACGSTPTTPTGPSTTPTSRASGGCSARCGTPATSTRATRSSPTADAAAPRCRATSSASPARTATSPSRRSTCASRSSSATSTSSCGPPRRGRWCRTSAPRSVPTSTTCACAATPVGATS